MKNFLLALITLISVTAQSENISKDWSGNSISFEITKMVIDPLGLKTFEVSVTSTKNVDLELIFQSAPYQDGVLLSGSYSKEKVFVNIIKGQPNLFSCPGKIFFQGSEKALIQISARWDNGTQSENLFVDQNFLIPQIRKLIVFSTASVTASQIIVNSSITTSNLDDIASFEVTDANGNSLMKLTETISATVDPVNLSKSIVIDLNQYPTAANLTTTSSTGGSQKLKLKSANVGISDLVSNKVLTDETTISYISILGQVTETTWEQEKNKSRDGVIRLATGETFRKPQIIE